MKHTREPCNAEIKVQLPQSLLDRLELAAAANRRKPSQFLRIVIEDALEARQQHQAAT